ncbi:MAG: 5-oxoprolinase subunit PxpA [Verrucomicrobiota bacterium]
MEQVILNIDLGEGEPHTESVHFIECIDAANIACGGHAGTQESMKICMEACLAYQTLPGAHPGLPSHFGRGYALPSGDELYALLETQWTALSSIAESLGTSLHHIKLHGSLYMAVEQSEELSATYLKFLNTLTPKPVVFALAEGHFQQIARSTGITVWGELFGDRHYEPDGSLRARNQSDALILDPGIIESRLKHWLSQGAVQTVDSSWKSLNARTICLHSDTPNALATARRVQALLAGMRKQ